VATFTDDGFFPTNAHLAGGGLCTTAGYGVSLAVPAWRIRLAWSEQFK
jgi:hypothetical protein